MKKPSADLFHLVHSLTKSEKRYMKLFAGKQDKKYLRLFDALLQMPAYDEQKLHENHEGESFLRYLPVNKQYLYEFILKALDLFHSKDEAEILRKQSNYARILLKKGLPDQAGKQIKKAKKRAYQYGFGNIVLDLLITEKEILSAFPGKQFNPTQLNRIYQEEKICLAKLSDISEYWRLNSGIFSLQMQFQQLETDEQQKHLKSFADNPRFQDEKLPQTPESQIHFLQAKATWHFTSRNPEKAAHYNEQLMELLDTNPFYLKRFPERYLSAINNFLIDNLILRNYKAFEQGLEKLDELVKRPAFQKIKNLEAKVFQRHYLLEINRWLAIGDIKKGVALIADVKKGLEQHKKNIPGHNRITFQYMAAYLLFLDGRYEEAHHWINLILGDTRQEVVLELHTFAKVLNLLIHFELQNYRLLESLLPSTRQQLRNKRAPYKSEVLLFRYLQQSLSAINPKEQQTLTKAFWEEIIPLKNEAKEKRFFEYLDFEKWLETKKGDV